MKKLAALSILLTWACYSFGQDVDKLIHQDDVERIIKTLAADDMQGRRTFTPGIEKAAQFIEGEFNSIGLKPMQGDSGYRQNFSIKRKAGRLFNIVGLIPGKTKPGEYVIFSGHYDHLGILSGSRVMQGDSIANGADDDASGTTAVITLARYFKALNNNARTLVFVAFTAEEIGEYGSQYFATTVKPDSVVAMFNIEMIGKTSKWGKNAAFITGFERSDFGTILQKNLAGTVFNFYPDPYTSQNLFYRSDNASLAKVGVPAHTISTVQIDKDTYYHTVKDEFSTLDAENITSTIKAIALSARTIVSGQDTPARVAKLER